MARRGAEAVAITAGRHLDEAVPGLGASVAAFAQEAPRADGDSDEETEDDGDRQRRFGVVRLAGAQPPQEGQVRAEQGREPAAGLLDQVLGLGDHGLAGHAGPADLGHRVEQQAQGRLGQARALGAGTHEGDDIGEFVNALRPEPLGVSGTARRLDLDGERVRRQMESSHAIVDKLCKVGEALGVALDGR